MAAADFSGPPPSPGSLNISAVSNMVSEAITAAVSATSGQSMEALSGVVDRLAGSEKEKKMDEKEVMLGSNSPHELTVKQIVEYTKKLADNKVKYGSGMYTALKAIEEDMREVWKEIESFASAITVDEDEKLYRDMEKRGIVKDIMEYDKIRVESPQEHLWMSSLQGSDMSPTVGVHNRLPRSWVRSRPFRAAHLTPQAA